MHINIWRNVCYELAREKGFHETPRSPLEEHALISSEVGEATEAVRDGLANSAIFCKDKNGLLKPEGEAYEIIDVIIRCLDYCGKMGWDVEQLMQDKIKYNMQRPHKHGKTM